MPGEVGQGSAACSLHGWAGYANELDVIVESPGGPDEGGSMKVTARFGSTNQDSRHG